MVINGDFDYKKAIILTPDRIDDLVVILQKYYNSIRFEAETYDNRLIHFDSKDELVEYDNFKKGRIKELKIICYDKSFNNLWLHFKHINKFFKAIGYGTSVECDYNISTIDKEKSLKDDLFVFFEKCKASYWLLGKFSACGLTIFTSLITMIVLLFNNDMNFDITIPTVYTVLAMFVAFAFWTIPISIDFFVINKLFPAVVYKWGEEVSRQEKLEKRRSNIFWGVIVAFAVGIATTIVCNYIIK